jgi:hypothetical protein
MDTCAVLIFERHEPLFRLYGVPGKLTDLGKVRRPPDFLDAGACRDGFVSAPTTIDPDRAFQAICVASR